MSLFVPVVLDSPDQENESTRFLIEFPPLAAKGVESQRGAGNRPFLMRRTAMIAEQPILRKVAIQ